MTARIRAVLIGISPMFCDIVKRSVARYITLEIIGELKTRESLERLRNLAPELVLIGLSPGDRSDDVGQKILKVIPAARVIVFSSDKRDGYLYEMRPKRANLYDISPDKLVKAIAKSRIGGCLDRNL